MLRNEGAAEVELIVGVARETDEVRRSRREQRVVIQRARALIVFLIDVGIFILAAELAVVVIPEEGILDVLPSIYCIGIGIVEVGDSHFFGSRVCIKIYLLELTQPVFMAYLRAGAVCTRRAAAVEVRYLTLFVGGY